MPRAAEQLALAPILEGAAAEVLGVVAASGGKRKGRGRPPGAKNRRTVELIAWLERRGHRSPQEWLSSLVNAPTAHLAKALGCEPLDVLKLQTSAAQASLPYWGPKQPTEVEKAITGAIEMVMDEAQMRQMSAVMDGAPGVFEDVAPELIAVVKGVEYQEVSDDDNAPVGDWKSDDDEIA